MEVIGSINIQWDWELAVH